jgi:hypothetical protein
MNKIRRTQQLLTVLLILVIISCSRARDSVPPMLSPALDTTAVLNSTGNFYSGPYGTVVGKAEIYKQTNSFFLSLKNFIASSGPDLHVYLSKEVQPISFIDLGKLKQNSGDQVYSITGSPDFSQYKYALIHCQQYNHLFGYALLQ